MSACVIAAVGGWVGVVGLSRSLQIFFFFFFLLLQALQQVRSLAANFRAALFFSSPSSPFNLTASCVR